MKIHSLQKIFHAAELTAGRFPMTILASAGATVIGTLIPHFGHGGNESRLWILLMTFAIAIPFSFALTSFNERKNTSAIVRAISMLLLVVLSALFYITGNGHTLQNQVTRFLLINFAAFMLVSVSPFLGAGTTNGFWQFNKSLLLRFLLSTLFSLVLYLGITIAIFALNHLFKTKIEMYEELWFVTIGIFHTWFFLSGLTADYDGLDRNTDYPRGLRIFTQYVLLPLVTIYLLILYAYLLTILIAWRFPVGWVSYLVLGFSITGIFALLLIYPLQENTENRWIRIFARWFFPVLLPPVILLFLSIIRRIHDFGFTENRYFVLVLSLWLAGISLFYAISKFRNIIVIPFTLCIIAVLAAIGPWSAFSISEKSQQKILTALLEQNKLMKDGKAQKSSALLSNGTRQQISSVVDYLSRSHGAAGLQPFFTANLDSLVTAAHSDNRDEQLSEEVHRLLGIRYYKHKEQAFKDDEGYLNFNFSPAVQPAISIKGFDYDLPITMKHWGDDTAQSRNEGRRDFPATDDTFHVWVGVTGKISFRSAKGTAMEVNLSSLIDSLKDINAQQISDQNMSMEKENEQFVTRFVFTRLSGRKKNQDLLIRELDGRILVRQKN